MVKIISFTIVAQRMATYLKDNTLINILVQKASLSGFSGCLEHSTIIWHQIQAANKTKTEILMSHCSTWPMLLDLSLILSSGQSFTFLCSSDHHKVVRSCFQDLQFCLTTSEYTTSWQSLEIGIKASCSPLAFTMVRWVVGGEHLHSRLWLPPSALIWITWQLWPQPSHV